MFSTTTPVQVIPPTQLFISDEVHITGKASGTVVAVLTFVAVDTNCVRIPGIEPIVITLQGEAYNAFYSKWNCENALYSEIKTLVGTPGTGVTGPAHVLTASVVVDTEEILNTGGVASPTLPEPSEPLTSSDGTTTPTTSAGDGFFRNIWNRLVG